MKLLFPNSEHGPFEIKEGVTRVGSAAGSDLTIVAPGVQQSHCEIHCAAEAVWVRPCGTDTVVVINGKQVHGESPLKVGDLLLFAKVGVRVVASERANPSAAVPLARKAEPDDEGRTRVRMALPKFMLRGVSGSTFGKNFPVFGTMTVGRHSDCDISIPGEEISRHHVRLQVMPDGLAVEDLGSANGTYIGDKRIHRGMLKPGEEIRLDTLRFLLVAPSLESQGGGVKNTPVKPLRAPAPAEPEAKGVWPWIAAFGLLGLLALGAWWYLGGAP